MAGSARRRQVLLRAAVALLVVAGLGDVAAHSVQALHAFEEPAHLATFAGMVATLSAVVDRGRCATARPRPPKEHRNAIR